MSIPETLLSAPLSAHLYLPFIKAYTNPNLSNLQRSRGVHDHKLETSMALSLRLKQNSPSITSEFQPHTAELTPFLTKLGSSFLDREVAARALNRSITDLQVITKSLMTELKDRFDLDQGLDPDLCPSLKTVSTASYDRLCNYLFWHYIAEQSVLAARASTWIPGTGSWTCKLLSIVLFDGRYVVLSRDACLMLKDSCASLFLVTLFGELHLCPVDIIPILDCFETVGYEILTAYGESGYEIIKSIESFCRLRLIQMSETILDINSQIESITQKYRDKEDKFRVNQSTFKTGKRCNDQTTYLTDNMWRLVASCSEPEEVSELFSLMKVLGHPYIDPVSGCESSRKLAQEEKVLSPIAIKQLEWSFCHLYTRGYISKTGRWPDLSFDLPYGVKSTLYDLWESNHPSLPLGLGLYDISDWDYVTFKPHIPFNFGDDFLDLMSDKALSYKRSEIDNSWFGRLPFKPKRPTSSNRVLEELLSRKSFDMREICQLVSERQFPFDWLVVTVSPKEREMKLDPRMFAMMVLEMRSFFVLTEKNLADGVFQYFPEQTMTMSKSELVSKFLSLTMIPLSVVRAYIEIDFSRWNLQFRDETVDPVGRRLNQIYGAGRLFDVIHTFYKTCLMVLRHSAFTPSITKPSGGILQNEPGVWNSHPAGLEGIWQKGWTFLTVCIIHSALWVLGLAYHIIGQGDNQVVVVDIPIDSNMPKAEQTEKVRRVVARCKAQISRYAKAVGHEVKEEECTEATQFVSYGKELWYKGRVLPTTCKSVSRMIYGSSPDVPSFFKALSNISATGVATSDRAQSTLPIFVMTKIIERFWIEREFRVSLYHGLELENSLWAALLRDERLSWATLLTLVPANLGGFPVASLAEFMYRGHTDPLSSSLAALSLFRRIPVVERFFSLLLSDAFYTPNPDIEGLILDPFSVPLSREAPGESRTVSMIRPLIEQTTKLPDIRALFTMDSTNRSGFLKEVSLIRPFYPKVSHDLYKTSIYGVADTFAKRFSNTRTFLGLGRRSGFPIVSRSLALDKIYILGVCKTLALSYKVATKSPVKSIYQLASDMRRRWGVGTLEGLTTVHPLDSTLSRAIPSPDKSIISDPDDIGQVWIMSLHKSSKEVSCERGAVNPFLGSLTGDKSVTKWIKPADSTPPLEDALKILQIRELLTHPGTSLWSFVTRCAQSRCDFDPSRLQPFVKKKVGGVIAHRYNMTQSTMGSYLNTPPNWATHLTVSSNRLGKVGELDCPISIGEVYLTGICLTQWFYQHRKVSAPFGVVMRYDSRDLIPVQDHILTTSRDLKEATVPIAPQLFYAQATYLNVHPVANRSALLLQRSLPFNQTEPTVIGALGSLFFNQVTSATRFIRRHHYVRAESNPSRVVDLPECGLLTAEEFASGIVAAGIMNSSLPAILRCNKSLPLRESLAICFQQSLLRLVPQLQGTLKHCKDIPTPWAREGLTGSTREHAIRWWVVSCEQRILRPGILTDVLNTSQVYESGVHTISRQVSALIGVRLTQLNLDGVLSVRNAKHLARCTFRVLDKIDELRRLAELTLLSRLVNAYGVIHTVPTSPEETLRSLRSTRLQPSPVILPLVRLVLPNLLPSGSCTGTDCRIELMPHASRENSVSRLFRIKGSSNLLLSRSAEKWAPIHSYLHPSSSVAVIGIGNGGILRCVPSSCGVHGFEIPSSLLPLGQEFTTYDPPYSHPGFTLDPVSWQLSGDISDSSFYQIVKRIVSLKISVALLDVDVSNPCLVLQARQYIASQGVKCFSRVRIDRLSFNNLQSSFCAFRQADDIMWEVPGSDSTELIVGCSNSPLGILSSSASICSHFQVTRLTPLDIPELDRDTQWKMAYWIACQRPPPLNEVDPNDIPLQPPANCQVSATQIRTAWESNDCDCLGNLPSYWLKALTVLFK